MNNTFQPFRDTQVYKGIYNDPPNCRIYDVNKIKIEFVKSYLLQSNKIPTNTIPTNTNSNYGPFNDKNSFEPVQFEKNDNLGYIKMKNKNPELWLSEDDKTKRLFFDILRKGLFWWQAPLVVWFDYISVDTFILYKFQGKRLSSLIEIIHNRNQPYISLPDCPSKNSKEQSEQHAQNCPKRLSNKPQNNMEYLIYNEDNNKVNLIWIKDINKATRFKFDKLNLNSFVWNNTNI